MSINLEKNSIRTIIKREKLQICVVCYGGCSSNTLINTLTKNNYICKTSIWDKILCHCPDVIDVDIPIIYIYRNPIHAFLSMKRRNKNEINQKKLSNYTSTQISDETLLKLMIKQFYTWTSKKSTNILIIKYEELFLPEIKYKLHVFLNNYNLKHFPIEYKPPYINDNIVNNLQVDQYELFEKYKQDIDYINNFDVNNMVND